MTRLDAFLDPLAPRAPLIAKRGRNALDALQASFEKIAPNLIVQQIFHGESAALGISFTRVVVVDELH